jgi:hypothetical protein
MFTSKLLTYLRIAIKINKNKNYKKIFKRIINKFKKNSKYTKSTKKYNAFLNKKKINSKMYETPINQKGYEFSVGQKIDNERIKYEKQLLEIKSIFEKCEDLKLETFNFIENAPNVNFSRSIISPNVVSEPAEPMNPSINIDSSNIYNIDFPKGYKSFRIYKHKFNIYPQTISSNETKEYKLNLDNLNKNSLKYNVHVNKYSAYKLKSECGPNELKLKNNRNVENTENLYETIENFYNNYIIDKEIVPKLIYTYCLEIIYRLIEVYNLSPNPYLKTHNSHLDFVEQIYKFLSKEYKDEIFDKFIISDHECIIKFVGNDSEFLINNRTTVKDVEKNISQKLFEKFYE